MVTASTKKQSKQKMISHPVQVSANKPVDPSMQTLRQALNVPRLVTSAGRKLPDFIIIGAFRAGSTALYDYLMQHPMVVPGATRSTFFFNLPVRPKLFYQSYFPRKKQYDASKLTGECTPYYMVNPAVPERIAQTVPHVKLLAVLRNPIDRAWAHYLYNRQNNLEELETFEEAIVAEKDRLGKNAEEVRLHSYLLRGQYADELSAWYKIFDNSQLKVVLADDLFNNTDRTLDSVADFLEIPEWIPDHFSMQDEAEINEPMNPRTREKLAAYFAPHNAKLSRLLGYRVPWPGG